MGRATRERLSLRAHFIGSELYAPLVEKHTDPVASVLLLLVGSLL